MTIFREAVPLGLERLHALDIIRKISKLHTQDDKAISLHININPIHLEPLNGFLIAF